MLEEFCEQFKAVRTMVPMTNSGDRGRSRLEWQDSGGSEPVTKTKISGWKQSEVLIFSDSVVNSRDQWRRRKKGFFSFLFYYKYHRV